MIQPQRKGIRKMYDTLALLAVVNVIALAGVVGYFASNGTLTVEKLREAVAVLRGLPKADPAAPEKIENKKSAAPEAVARGALSSDELDMMQKEAERLKTEIDQRTALANSIMLKVKTEREAFRKEKEAAAKQEEADKAKLHDEGFQKQLQILTALSPKVALGHILALNDPDKAAQILAAMDSDRAKKIVESAKKGDDLARMKLILQRMRDVPGIGELRAQADEQP